MHIDLKHLLVKSKVNSTASKEEFQQFRRILTQLLKGIVKQFLLFLSPRKIPATKEKSVQIYHQSRRVIHCCFIASLSFFFSLILKINSTVLSTRTSGSFMWGEIKLVLFFQTCF